MKHLRSFTLSALVMVTIAGAAGCGTPGAPAGTGLGLGLGLERSARQVMVQGQARKLGYDWQRYKQVIKPRQKPTRMPRQGLLPRSADNRADCAPVYDQGKLGACTAFAIGKGLRESLQRRNGEQAVPLSALFLYYETRKRLGTVKEDSGGTITDGMAALKQQGIAPEADWPYQVAQFTVKPPKKTYTAAKGFRIQEATQLAGLEDVKTVLSKGQTVAFGYVVYESFTKIGKDGRMPLPKEGEKALGGHAVLAVGYDDAKQSLIVRNSWGDGWGDGGYFHMPYAFAESDNTGDYWTGR